MVLANQIITIMNKLFKIALLLLFPITLYSQKKQNVTYWIPQIYIDNLVKNGVNNEQSKYLKPIQTIVHKNNKWYIETYNGMFQPLIQKGGTNPTEIVINGLSLNLNVFTKIEQDSINKIKFSFKRDNDSIVVEGRKDNKLIESKKFIKEFNGYKFEELRKIKEIFLLQGRYNIYNLKGEKIESEIEFTPSGNINRSTLLKTFELKRVMIPDEKNNYYNLVRFSLKRGKSINLAFIYDEKTKSWSGYEYITLRDKYTIHISPKCKLKIVKI
jgi:hypothetical protein